MKVMNNSLILLLFFTIFSSFSPICLVASAADASFPSSRSVQDDDYIVRGVDVDITAKSAYEARALAIKQAEEKAFHKLLEKLLSPADRSKIPLLDSRNLEDYVDDFEVFNEKISRVRYLASFSVTFKPHKIKSLFARHGLSPTLQLSSISVEGNEAHDTKPALMVPILIQQKGLSLWDERSPWFQIWSRVDSNEKAIVVPIGDLNDVRDLSAEAAHAGALENIAGLLDRYALEQALVTVLDVRNMNAPKLEILQYSKDGLLRKTGVLPLEAASNLSSIIGQAEKKTRSLLASLMGTFDDSARLVDISARILFSSLKEWHFIREKLELLPTVKDVKVHSLKHSFASVSLKILGTTDSLKSLLKGSEIQVMQETDNSQQLVLKRNETVTQEKPNVDVPFAGDVVVEQSGSFQDSSPLNSDDSTPPQNPSTRRRIAMPAEVMSRPPTPEETPFAGRRK